MLRLVETHDFIFFIDTQADSLLKNKGEYKGYDEGVGAGSHNRDQLGHQLFEISRQQAGVSQSISRNMQVLREISSQTAESTTATSTSIGKLAELAAQLRKSVAGFRLPGSMRGGTGEFPALRAEDTQTLTPAENLERVRRVGGLVG